MNDCVGFVLADMMEEEEEMLNMEMRANVDPIALTSSPSLSTIILEVEQCPVTEEEVFPVVQISSAPPTTILVNSAKEEI